jgi:hypothetical protein
LLFGLGCLGSKPHALAPLVVLSIFETSSQQGTP